MLKRMDLLISSESCFVFLVNSTITTWGKDGEKEAFRNMLEQVRC